MNNLIRLAAVLLAYLCVSAGALAQNAGTVANHSFAIGKGAGQQGFTSLPCGAAAFPIGQAGADPICQSMSGDITISAAGVTAIGAAKVTSAMLNASVFSTAHSWGGVQTFTNPVLGTPSSLTLTNALGLPFVALPAGTSDTVLGYWGSTVVSALAIGNCSNALTYNTSTHTFGCNSTAGTGTVTVSGTPTSGQFALWTTSTNIQGVSPATKSDEQTGSSATAAVTPSQQQQHDSAAKASVSFTGSTAAILASYNISGVVRNSAGSYTISFSTAFASTAYVCHITVTGTSGGLIGTIASKSVGSITINALNLTPVGADPAGSVDVVCFGRQ